MTATCSRSCAARGWTLGGEQSGHIIDMGFNRTGDGIASALLDAGGARPGATSASATRCSKLPQTPRQRRVRDRDASPARPPCRPRSPPPSGARGTGPGARPPERHRAARAGDGRGADASRRPRRSAGAGCAGRSSAGSADALSGGPGPLVSSSGVRNRRLRRGRPVREVLLAGLSKLEYRGYDSAGHLGDLRRAHRGGPGGRQPRARCATSSSGRRGSGAVAAASARDDRDRPHPLGDPRAGQRGERASPLRQRRPRPRRRQRDRRELHGTEGELPRAAASSPPRPTPR